MPAWIAEDGRRWNHIRLDLYVLGDERFDAHHLSVYCALVAHAEVGSGLTELTIDSICQLGRCQERTARYKLAELEKWGYIRKKHLVGKASSFVILPPPGAASDAGVQIVNPGNDPGNDPGKKRRDALIQEVPDLQERKVIENDDGTITVLDPRATRERPPEGRSA